ncbi:MAG: penicillin-binding protein 1C [Deltaproteobacteria bacterium]|nr:penicillin-binding protein 1C [Deltaproteobacteria bacterium]
MSLWRHIAGLWRRARAWLLRLVVASLSLGLFIALSAQIWASLQRLPPGCLEVNKVASRRVVDRKGRLLREVPTHAEGRARWTRLKDLSPHLLWATLTAEDRRFFRHHGVDWLAAARATGQNLRSLRVVSGASTLTMQLARLLDAQAQSGAQGGARNLLAGAGSAPATSRKSSHHRKARQVALAYRLERRLSKLQILEHYLNRAPYGSGTLGAEAAARRYFDKPAAQLSPAEAALLASLPKSPSGYNPFSGRRKRLLRRQRHILREMHKRGLLSTSVLRLALAERLDLNKIRYPFRAPHLVDHALALATPTKNATVIETTLALPLQREVERLARAQIAALKDQRVSNAAVLVVDNASGEVLAHVGSVDYSGPAGQVDGTRAKRQPGSALKPFTYALALERGMTPASLLADLPAFFGTEHGDYAPRNYDGVYHGPVRLRVALASSYNIPAIRVAQRVGVPRLLERLRALGFGSLTQNAKHYGLGLTLGNGEVTLEQLVAAYATLARGGRSLPLRRLRATTSASGTRHALPMRKSKPVIDARAAYLIAHILADPRARQPAFGRHGPLEVPFWAAVKTGTSKDFRDNFTVGFSRRVTVGVWVGNFDGSPMARVSGVTGAGPLWAKVITAARRYLGEEQPHDAMPRPAGLVETSICALSGALATSRCPASNEELFVDGSAPGEPCTFHQEVALEKKTGLRAGPGCARSQVEYQPFIVYPVRYRRWARRRKIPAPPTTYAPRCPAPARHEGTLLAGPAIEISFPTQGDIFHVDPDLRPDAQAMPLEANVRGAAVAEVRWMVDDALVAKSAYPYSASWRISRGKHRVVALLPDGSRSAVVTISVQ